MVVSVEHFERVGARRNGHGHAQRREEPAWKTAAVPRRDNKHAVQKNVSHDIILMTTTTTQRDSRVVSARFTDNGLPFAPQRA